MQPRGFCLAYGYYRRWLEKFQSHCKAPEFTKHLSDDTVLRLLPARIIKLTILVCWRQVRFQMGNGRRCFCVSMKGTPIWSTWLGFCPPDYIKMYLLGLWLRRRSHGLSQGPFCFINKTHWNKRRLLDGWISSFWKYQKSLILHGSQEIILGSVMYRM